MTLSVGTPGKEKESGGRELEKRKLRNSKRKPSLGHLRQEQSLGDRACGHNNGWLCPPQHSLSLLITVTLTASRFSVYLGPLHSLFLLPEELFLTCLDDSLPFPSGLCPVVSFKDLPCLHHIN